jgi:molecular chaperone GrpE
MQDIKSDNSDENIIDEQFLDSDLDSKIKEVIDDHPLSELSEPTYDELVEERDILKDRLMRSLADLENLRKRSDRDRKDAELYGGTKLARDLLSVFDNMSRALDNIDEDLREKASALVEGLELTQRELLSIFLRHKIDQIEPKEGEKFDPKYHQAMFEAPIVGTEKGSIIQVMTKGFKIGDRLLRASQVGVSSNTDPITSTLEKSTNMEDKSSTSEE